MTTEIAWQQTTLGDVVCGHKALQTGPFGNQLRASDYVAEGIPVVMPRDIPGGTISQSKAARVSTEKAQELPNHRLRAGDIILARRGEMGRCAQVQPKEEGWLCGTGCLRIRPNRWIDGGYLAQYLRWPAICGWLEGHAVGQTLPSLNTRILAKIPLNLPPVNEQQRISKMLEATDRTIAASRQVIHQIERVRNGFLKDMLTRGSESGCAILPGGRLVPADWKYQKIRALCQMSNGHAFKARERSPEGWPIIRIRNLNGSNEFNFFGGHPSPRWIVNEGDLLFAWAGVKGSSFGPRIWAGPKGVLNQHIFRVEPRNGIVKEWLFEALRLVTRDIEERAQGFKASLLHVRKADLMEYRLPVPPLRVQRWISEQSTALAKVARVEHSALNSLKRLKQGLAEDLFTGRVRT